MEILARGLSTTMVIYLAGACLAWWLPLWATGDFHTWRAHWRDAVRHIDKKDPDFFRQVENLSALEQAALVVMIRALFALWWPRLLVMVTSQSLRRDPP